MAISTKGGRSSGSFIQLPGAIASSKVVESVELFSGKPYMDGWNADDLGIKIVFVNPYAAKNDWQDDLYLAGSMKYDADGLTESFGGGFKVREVFEFQGIDVDWGDAQDAEGNPITTINQEALDALVGKTFLVLRYDHSVDNSGERPKMKRYTYRRIEVTGSLLSTETDEDAAQRLYEKFLSDVDGGYIKDWRGPQGFGAKADEKPVGVEGFGAPSATVDPFAGVGDVPKTADDDLPF